MPQVAMWIAAMCKDVTVVSVGLYVLHIYIYDGKRFLLQQQLVQCEIYIVNTFITAMSNGVRGDLCPVRTGQLPEFYEEVVVILGESADAVDQKVFSGVDGRCTTFRSTATDK